VRKLSAAVPRECEFVIPVFVFKTSLFEQNTNGYSGARLASKIDTLLESTVPSFSFASTDKCDAIVKLSAESFTSMVKDFDTSIKFNASTAEEYVDLRVVPESL